MIVALVIHVVLEAPHLVLRCRASELYKSMNSHLSFDAKMFQTQFARKGIWLCMVLCKCEQIMELLHIEVTLGSNMTLMIFCNPLYDV